MVELPPGPMTARKFVSLALHAFFHCALQKDHS